MSLRASLFAGAAALAVLIGLGGHVSGALDATELRTVDARFEVRGTQPAPDDIVVIAIDDVTFSDLGEQWPFPRALHAEAVLRLDQAEVERIAFDVQFTEASDDPDGDDALIDAVQRTKDTVLATTETDEAGEGNVFGGAPVNNARTGNALLPPDPGDYLRRIPYEVGGLRAFSLIAAEPPGAETITQDDLGGDTAPIDYRGPAGTFTTYSYSDVVSGAIGAEQLRGRIAVIGPTVPSLQDLHPTPMGAAPMAGAEIQANAIDTARRGFPLQPVPEPVDLALILACALAGPLLLRRVRPVLALPALVALAAALLGGAQLLFTQGDRIVAVAAPALALLTGSGGALAAALIVGSVDRRRLRDAFARFVPEAVVDEVLADAGGAGRLAGVERDATVLFSDLRGFTRLAEEHPPDRLFAILNRYLTAMTDVILAHGGTLVAYMGDGIMAVFGAPLEQGDHADRALAAAREMTGPVLRTVNEELAERYGLAPVQMGIGLNSGTVFSGNVGSERRMEYSAIGDTTNIAARLQVMTREAGHPILLGDATRERLERADGLERVDELELRGRSAPVVVWGA